MTESETENWPPDLVLMCTMPGITRIFEIIRRQAEQFPKSDSLLGKVGGQWVATSTADYIAKGVEMSKGLLSMGLKKGDAVAMISANRPEWNISDLGMLQIGVVNVPVYTTLSESEITFILNDCKARLIIAGDAELYKKVNNIRNKVPSLMEVYSFDQLPGVPNWNDILQKGKSFNSDIEEAMNSIQPSDLATLLYTSGTTGTPKGVMLTHDNIVSNVLSSEHLCPVGPKDRALSFLPLCHSYERMLTYLYQFIGVSIYYAESMERLPITSKK